MYNPKILRTIAVLLPAFVLILLNPACQQTGNPQKPESDGMGTLMEQKQKIRSEIKDKVMMSKSGRNVYLPFRNPEERVAKDGVLDTEIDISYKEHQMWNVNQGANVTVKLRSYGKGLVGPTFRIKPSDILRVKMMNNLPLLGHQMPCNPFEAHHHEIAAEDSCNQIDPVNFNTTNLHVHGLHVNPKDSADNVLLSIEPGCEFQNHIPVPGDHPTGTFWYHAHVHGATAIQVSSGMEGALIIEGGLDTVKEIAAAKELIFLLQQVPYTRDTADQSRELYGVEDFSDSFGPGVWQQGVDSLGWRTTINGQTYPVIEMKSGEVQRWRFIHGGVRETVMLKFDGHQLHEIAMDGIALGRIETQDSVELEPGYRSDILVKARNFDKDTVLFLIDEATSEANALNRVFESPKILAIVKISAQSDDMPLPSSSSLAAYAPFKTITPEELNGEKQKVVFNISNGCFTVNGRPFSMEHPPRELVLNTASEWEISSLLASHPYHIHVNHFELFSVEDTAGNIIKKFDPPIWKDTYMVKVNEIVRIRSRYKDFDGEFVLHCHILDHEDQGMMELVKIVDKGLPAL